MVDFSVDKSIVNEFIIAEFVNPPVQCPRTVVYADGIES